jgi:uncharacterized Zn finger protein
MYMQWAPYVPVAERRRKAAAEMAKLATKGYKASPVRIEGRKIATTSWGTAWCANLEHYSDYANRLPRGRTYVRNGSVVDLQIAPGSVQARVSGSSIYRTTITVKPLAAATWSALCADCAGGIDSLVELLQGRFATGVMERLCRHGDGLFPVPQDIRFDCSCPDSAAMCKHVAAVLYGIGARFDHQPELLFALRQVDASALLASAGDGLAVGGASDRALDASDVGALFGLEMEDGQGEPEQVLARKPARKLARKPAREPAREPGVPAKRPSGRATGVTPTAQATSAKRSRPAERNRTAPRPRTAGRTTSAGRPSAAHHEQSQDPAAILLRALHEHGVLDNASGRAATGLDGASVRLLLQQLVAQGQARVVGQKRGTRYLPVRR